MEEGCHVVGGFESGDGFDGFEELCALFVGLDGDGVGGGHIYKCVPLSSFYLLLIF